MAFLKNIPTNATDAELVVAYKETGNMEVLGQLYTQYADLIYGVCLKYLKQAEEAQDAVMQIFEELISKVKKYEIQHFRAWLYQLAKNHCLMKLRSSKKNPRIVEMPVMQSMQDEHPDEAWQREEHLQKMESCIEKLAAEQKEAVSAFYLKQQSYKEIAEKTELDIKTVRSFIQNGRRNLKICMERIEEN